MEKWDTKFKNGARQFKNWYINTKKGDQIEKRCKPISKMAHQIKKWGKLIQS